MEDKFFDLYSRQGCLALEVGHNSVADWNVIIYDTKGRTLRDCEKPTIHIQGRDRARVFAEAFVKLADYLSETRDGY